MKRYLSFQFSIRTLLLLTFVIAVCIGLRVQHVRKQQRAFKALEQRVLSYTFDWEEDLLGKPIDPDFDNLGPPNVPRFLFHFVEVDYFQEVVAVRYNGDADGLKYLQAFPSLRELEIYGKFDRQDSDLALQHISKLSHLQSLEFSNYEEIQEGSLKHLLKLSTLKELDLDGKKITDKGLKIIGEIKSLEKLSIDSSLITDKGLKTLSKLPQLEELSIAGTDITNQGVQYLGQLHSLKILDIGSCIEITEEVLQPIAKFLSLEELYLNTPVIEGFGLKYLQGNTSLKILDLSSTSLRDLNHLPTSVRLRDLYLEDTEIGDNSISKLAGLKDLQCLNLEGTNVTPAGIQQLKQLRPKLRIWD